MENIINEMKELSKKYEDYILISIDEDSNYILGWLGNPLEENQDLPIIVYDKKTQEVEIVNLPPEYNADDLKEIWNYENDPEYIENNKEKIAKIFGIDIKDIPNADKGDKSMTEKNIKDLLKKYGADEGEIKNFMEDLAEMKDDIEDIAEAQKDEEEGIKDYQEMKDTNNDDSDDKDLEEIKQDESKHNDYLLNAENVKLLKATEEGKDLIMNAPKMAKEELEEAIKKYLESVKK